MGGTDRGNVLKSVECLNMKEPSEWLPLPDMNVARFLASAEIMKGAFGYFYVSQHAFVCLFEILWSTKADLHLTCSRQCEENLYLLEPFH